MELCRRHAGGGKKAAPYALLQMKPRTIYEKAVQDFTEIAQQLARLNQRFRHVSFAEFEMLLGLDDEVLKRYGLPKQMVDRALLQAYQTVVLDQQRRPRHDGDDRSSREQ